MSSPVEKAPESQWEDRALDYGALSGFADAQAEEGGEDDVQVEPLDNEVDIFEQIKAICEAEAEAEAQPAGGGFTGDPEQGYSLQVSPAIGCASSNYAELMTGFDTPMSYEAFDPIPASRSASKRRGPMTIGELPSIPPPYRPPPSTPSSESPASATWEQTIHELTNPSTRPKMLAPPRQVHAESLNAYGYQSIYNGFDASMAAYPPLDDSQVSAYILPTPFQPPKRQRFPDGPSSSSSLGIPPRPVFDNDSTLPSPFQSPGSSDPSSAPAQESESSKRPRPERERSKRSTPPGTFIACHFCRSRKLKCDGSRPACSTCSGKGVVCEYSSTIRRRGPSKRRMAESQQQQQHGRVVLEHWQPG